MLLLLLLIGGLAAHFLLPVWWSMIPIALLCGYLRGRSGSSAFRSGFFANALLWLGLIGYDLVTGDMRLAIRSARLLFLPNWEILVLVTVIVGGLFSGVACSCGFHLRRALLPQIKKTIYES